MPCKEALRRPPPHALRGASPPSSSSSCSRSRSLCSLASANARVHASRCGARSACIARGGRVWRVAAQAACCAACGSSMWWPVVWRVAARAGAGRGLRLCRAVSALATSPPQSLPLPLSAARLLSRPPPLWLLLQLVACACTACADTARGAAASPRTLPVTATLAFAPWWPRLLPRVAAFAARSL